MVMKTINKFENKSIEQIAGSIAQEALDKFNNENFSYFSYAIKLNDLAKIIRNKGFVTNEQYLKINNELSKILDRSIHSYQERC